MPDSSPLKTQVMRFAGFELNVRAGELRKRAVKIKLQEQPLQILAMLLDKAINKLREALGDSADKPRFVETLPRRGYRFLAFTDGTKDLLAKRVGSIDSIAVFRLRIRVQTRTQSILPWGSRGASSTVFHRSRT